MKRKIPLILLILWIAFIFYNSIKSAPDSIMESSIIVDGVKNIISFIYNHNVPLSITTYLNETFETNLRDFAHFFEFFVLYILIYLNIKHLNMCGLKLLLNGLYLSLFVSVIDETIQLSSIGRSFQVTDIITDMLGSLLAFVVIYIISKYIKKDYGVCSV